MGGIVEIEKQLDRVESIMRFIQYNISTDKKRYVRLNKFYMVLVDHQIRLEDQIRKITTTAMEKAKRDLKMKEIRAELKQKNFRLKHLKSALNQMVTTGDYDKEDREDVEADIDRTQNERQLLVNEYERLCLQDQSAIE